MSPEEITVLQSLGSAVLPFHICDPIIASICYGLSLPVVYYALLIIWKQGVKTWARMVVFATSGICFLIATINLILRSAAFARYLQVPIALTRLSIYEVSTPANKHFAKLYLAGEFIQNVALNLSDAIIIWRAWVLYMDDVWAMSLPVLLLSASVVTIWTFRLINHGWEAWVVKNPAYYSLNLASNYLSLATNIVTVILYGWRLRRYYEQQPSNFMKYTKATTSPVERTMLLLLESGVAFCLIQVIAFILDTLNAEGILLTTSGTLAAQCFHQILYSLSTIYPTLVFVVVQTQHSITDTYILRSTFSCTSGCQRTLVGTGEESGLAAMEQRSR